MYYCYLHNWSSRDYQCPSCESVTTTLTGDTITYSIPMENKEPKPREFFTYTNSHGNYVLHDVRLASEPKHHLVDYSAFQAQQKEIEELNRKYWELLNDTNKDAKFIIEQNDKIQALEATNTIMREALEIQPRYDEDLNERYSWRIAQEALAKCGERANPSADDSEQMAKLRGF